MKTNLMEQPEIKADGYNEAMRWIFDRINYERVRPRTASGHFRLERIAALLDLIGAPSKKIPAIHIAGTKGKGSTAAMIDSVLRRSGIRSGLFTSPHIETFEERMKVDGRMPSPEEMVQLTTDLRTRLADAPSELQESRLTYFEVATLLAWMYFDSSDADVAVLETGLGGRLDCTNVCQPLVTLITSIGLDHTHILGDTIEQIATEKAGIIKPGVAVFASCRDESARDVLQRRAAELNCPLELIGRDFEVIVPDTDSALPAVPADAQLIGVRGPADDTDPACTYRLPLWGRHQADNAALAVRACQYLQRSNHRIDQNSIAEGIRHVDWPLRFETVATDPQVILDVAHNPDSVAAFCRTLTELQPGRPQVLIFASSQDKDYRQMLTRVARHFDTIVLTQYLENPRAVPCDQLRSALDEIVEESQIPVPDCRVHNTPAEALRQARAIAGPAGTVCGTGSFFLASELRNLVRESMVPRTV